MNAVDRIKEILKERKIPVSRMERDLGFANGYISQLKKGTMPAERLAAVAKYLDVSVEYLLYGGDRGNSSTLEVREELRESYAYRILNNTLVGATEADMLEAAALIARRKEERNGQ